MLPDADQLADVVTEAIRAVTVPLVTRLAVVEARDVLHGKDGVDGHAGQDGAIGMAGKDGADGQHGMDGKDGANGRDGIDGQAGRDGADGKDAPMPDVADLRERLTAMESRVPETIVPEDVEAEFRKALADWTIQPVMQKRILRDALGRVDRIIDEPVGA